MRGLIRYDGESGKFRIGSPDGGKAVDEDIRGLGCWVLGVHAELVFAGGEERSCTSTTPRLMKSSCGDFWGEGKLKVGRFERQGRVGQV